MLLHEKLNNYKIYLASQSPRRKSLLEGLDLKFEVFVKPGIEEIVPSGLSKTEIPLYLAEYKSNAYTELLKTNVILITADTIVWHNNRELGKPKDYADAVAILKELSGEMHEVITGVCIRSKNQLQKFHVLSNVWFRNITELEIEYYLSRYKPFDKAGAYGIQEWIGYVAIQKIEGSFYNVMGLPVQTLYNELLDFIENEKD
jgi:septum formation protein